MARRGAGLSGAALFVGIGGLYLAYAGVRDVALVDGLRSLLRGERPAETAGGWSPVSMAGVAAAEGDSAAPGTVNSAGDTGIDKLVGNARIAYTVLRLAFPSLTYGGWRARGSVPGSRHPLGKAIDVTGGPFSQGPAAADATAKRVIALFKTTPGARTWIWNNQVASAPSWSPHPYDGPSDHTDHVHLDWN